MGKRHNDALEINHTLDASCIARTLVGAFNETRAAGLNPAQDTACRLIVYQLGVVCGVEQLGSQPILEYGKMLNECVLAAATCPTEKK